MAPNFVFLHLREHADDHTKTIQSMATIIVSPIISDMSMSPQILADAALSCECRRHVNVVSMSPNLGWRCWQGRHSFASDWLSHTSSDANHVISADVDIAKPAADSDDDGCGDSDEEVNNGTAWVQYWCKYILEVLFVIYDDDGVIVIGNQAQNMLRASAIAVMLSKCHRNVTEA